MQESKDIESEDMSEVDECEECPDEKDFVDEQHHMNIDLKVKTSSIRKKWKVPISDNVAHTTSSIQISTKHDMKNKFSESPNTYKFMMDDKYIGLYDGLDKQFWKGYNAGPDKPVMCFIEDTMNHRMKSKNVVDAAFDKKDIPNYI